MQIQEGTIAAAVGGDRDALGGILATSYRELQLHLANKIGRPYQAVVSAEDVIQVTFLEAFLRIAQFQARSHTAFLAWLKRSAENNLRDAIRELDAAKRPSPRVQVHGSLQDESYVTLLATLTATGSTPSGSAAREEAKEAIERALAALPPVYAQVVRLYDLEGHPIADVATTMKKSPAAVHMIRARAHDRLRELLSDPGRFFST